MCFFSSYRIVQICHFQVKAEVCYQEAPIDAQMASILGFKITLRKGMMADFILCHWRMITLEWAIHFSIPGGGFTLLKRRLCSTSNKTKWLGQNTKLPNWNAESYNSVFTLSVHTLSHDMIVSDESTVFLLPSVRLFNPLLLQTKHPCSRPKTPRVILL